MKKRIAIIGSTGSIGTQTLNVVREQKSLFAVVMLVGNRNADLLLQQVNESHPLCAGTFSDDLTKPAIPEGTHWCAGMMQVNAMIRESEADIVVVAVSGAAGLLPTIVALESGKRVALATKEVMVLAGEFIRKKYAFLKRNIFPIDSEHSAVWQCLQSGKHAEIEKIILTCSGGPFRRKTKEELEKVTAKDALKHPTWKMGRKVTIDSATLMNKGLEVIEARWLFDVPAEKIEVVIHPQSILHSAVQFCDGSIIGQLGQPDMRIPIQYALSYPKRYASTFPRLSLPEMGSLMFNRPDARTFPCLRLAYDALAVGGTMPAVLNAANEVAVDLFLRSAIGFVDIPSVIEGTMLKHNTVEHLSLEDILQADRWARDRARMIARRLSTIHNV